MASERLTLTVGECARALGISRGLAYQLAKESKLPGCIRLAQKRYIVSRKRLEEWLDGAGADANMTDRQRVVRQDAAKTVLKGAGVQEAPAVMGVGQGIEPLDVLAIRLWRERRQALEE